MQKQCEFCKKEFEAWRVNIKFCSRKCCHGSFRKENKELLQAYYKDWKEKNKERVRVKDKTYKEKVKDRILIRSKTYYVENKERIQQRVKDQYDTRGCVLATDSRRKRMDRLKQDPVKYQEYLAKKREYDRVARQRKKLLKERDAWRADPINAARIAAINEQRLSPVDREAALDKAQEESYRKEVRAETRKTYAAQQVTASEVENKFPGVFEVEWSNL